MAKRKGVDNSQAKGTDAPSSTNNKTGDKMSPVQTQALAFVGKIESLRYEAPDFQTAGEMMTAYDAAHAEVKAGADAAMSSQADTILALAKVQAILSQRGANKAALRKEAGLRSWEEYYAWFQKEYDYKYCLRTVQRKIEALSGKVKGCKECGKETGHRKTCSRYEAPLLLTASDKRKLVDSALVAYEVIEAVKAGGNVEEAVKGLQRSLLPKDKLQDLVDHPYLRITQDKVPTETPKGVKSNVEYPDLDGDLKTETISVLTEVATQLQQGELAIKVRTLLGKLIGRMKAEPKAGDNRKGFGAAPKKLNRTETRRDILNFLGVEFLKDIPEGQAQAYYEKLVNEGLKTHGRDWNKHAYNAIYKAIVGRVLFEKDGAHRPSEIVARMKAEGKDTHFWHAKYTACGLKLGQFAGQHRLYREWNLVTCEECKKVRQEELDAEKKRRAELDAYVPVPEETSKAAQAGSLQ